MPSHLPGKYFQLPWWRDVIGGRYAYYSRRLFFAPRVVEQSIEGVPCKFFLANPTGAAWYDRGAEHTSLEMRFVRDRMLRPGMTVFEVGGHHGHTMIPLSAWAGEQGQVFVFEPIAENVAIIRENCRLNGLRNVEVIEAALGAETGTGCIAGASNGKIAAPASVTGRAADRPVNITTVDAFCRERKVRPDLIKIDVEGYELEVLAGAREAIAQGAQLQIELHSYLLPEFGHRPEDLWRLIDRDRYEVWLQRNDFVAPQPLTGTCLPGGRPHLYCLPRWPDAGGRRPAHGS